MNPLGNYGPLVAAVTALAVVLAYLAGALFQSTLGLNDAGLNSLKELALIAIGAVLGTSAGVAVGQNGLKRDVAALHDRLDQAGAPPSAKTDGGAA